jgi:quinol monooxygenase YgiN
MALLGPAAGAARMMAGTAAVGDSAMYGMIGKIKAKPGERTALAAILAGGTGSMPGCISYVVAEDVVDVDALWVTELWESKAAHDASLTLPAVKDAIAKGRPLIAGFDVHAETRPLSGVKT